MWAGGLHVAVAVLGCPDQELPPSPAQFALLKVSDINQVLQDPRLQGEDRKTKSNNKALHSRLRGNYFQEAQRLL